MWYHANQYHGDAHAESVDIAEGLHALTPGRHLDFGAGPGTSSLFFHELGWQVALADISTTFLDFARWRLARHGVTAQFYETSVDALPNQAFDLITAFDVMVHVGDVAATLERLHRALAPGGYLVFNIDIRAKTPETECHLYPNRGLILKHVRRAGFQQQPKIHFFYVYQKVERSAIGQLAVAQYDNVRFSTPVVAAVDRSRSVLKFR